MSLSLIIESAEKQYKQILEEFFVSVYNEKSISSHGIDHHRRVWIYSKELLNLVPLKSIESPSQLTSKLIVACYLHDIGMSVDPGVKHGNLSRVFCTRFLTKNNLPADNWLDVLEAIENHDNKDYEGNRPLNDLQTILSVSDDLDAFGFTGIFRYSEIYLTRGIAEEKMGHLIRENAKKRFDNFVKTFGSCDRIIQRHSARFNILDDFFENYNIQLPSYQFGTKHPHGYCGVIETIRFLMNNGLQLKNFFMEPEIYSDDPVIRRFYSELEKELN
jgi:HD superfamily phosphodiesterase